MKEGELLERDGRGRSRTQGTLEQSSRPSFRITGSVGVAEHEPSTESSTATADTSPHPLLKTNGRLRSGCAARKSTGWKHGNSVHAAIKFSATYVARLVRMLPLFHFWLSNVSFTNGNSTRA